MGQLTSMAFVQGAVSFHVFASSVYNYLCGMKVGEIVISEDEVADPAIKLILSKVINFKCT